MNDEKILVTGGAGFFGSHICEQALKNNYDIIVVDIFNSETSPASEKKKTLEYLKTLKNNEKKSQLKSYVCDIKDGDALMKIFIEEKPTIVVHAASLVMDRASVNIPIDFIQTNVVGTQNLLDAAYKINIVKKFIFLSTRSAIGEVVGPNSYMHEDDLIRPINPYGATKAAAEHLFHSFYHNYNIPVTICRMNPMYGPRCRPDMFVWRLLNSILTGDKIEKYGSGDAIRDWLFVKDAADAVLSMLFNPLGFEIINLGTGIGTSTNELINVVEKVTKKRVNIVEVEPVPGDAHFAGISDCSKVKNLIGWEPKTSLEDGIASTYHYMKKEYQKLK